MKQSSSTSSRMKVKIKVKKDDKDKKDKKKVIPRSHRAIIRIQASVRGWIIRRQMKAIWILVEERNRQRGKVNTLNKKFRRIQKERENLSKKGNVSGNMRQYWEESILKKLEPSQSTSNIFGGSGGDDEEELTPTGREIQLLQMEHKELKIRYKTIEGILRPLQKTQKNLMNEYEKHRETFTYHEGKGKEQGEHNDKLIARRQELEQRSIDLTDELRGDGKPSSLRNSMRFSSLEKGGGSGGAGGGGGDNNANLLQAMEDIMKIMETECSDPTLVADIRKKIDELCLTVSTIYPKGKSETSRSTSKSSSASKTRTTYIPKKTTKSTTTTATKVTSKLSSSTLKNLSTRSQRQL